jgi:ATP-dependent Clp protease protease subunit
MTRKSPILNMPRPAPVLFGKSKPGKAAGYSIDAAADGKSAEIFIYDVIGDPWEGTTGKQFKDDLKALGAVSTLNIFINSPGGSVFDGVAIFNQLDRHKARKVVHIDALAASIASVIAMAGDEIVIAANGMMMIHDPWTLAFGSAPELRKTADMLDRVRDTLLTTYVARTGGDADRIEAMMAEETWFGAEEAVDMGFADSIGNEVQIAAKLRGMDLSGFKHAPPDLIEAIPAAEASDSTDDPAGGAAGVVLRDPRFAQMKARLRRRNIEPAAAPDDAA